MDFIPSEIEKARDAGIQIGYGGSEGGGVHGVWGLDSMAIPPVNHDLWKSGIQKTQLTIHDSWEAHHWQRGSKLRKGRRREKILIGNSLKPARAPIWRRARPGVVEQLARVSHRIREGAFPKFLIFCGKCLDRVPGRF